ncbi:hypothetical protein Poly41_23830 [Novipirellula artificiosorum]|uniref:Uncharacterized protein n=1 Tax=Novipirellula artificiosorum TaxID=2528016 RepID=A0A5C6DRY4_9BACT|nr:hypothetical protein Poly41_23830 [Novipirellula artificiosorum]
MVAAAASWRLGSDFHAARTHFGTWNEAVIAADLEPESRFYTKKEILHMIRQRHDAGKSLSSDHPDVRDLPMLMVTRSRDRPLYEAALRHYGSWRAALTAAGINLANVSRRRPDNFDRETMILWLRNRQAAGEVIDLHRSVSRKSRQSDGDPPNIWELENRPRHGRNQVITID